MPTCHSRRRIGPSSAPKPPETSGSESCSHTPLQHDKGRRALRRRYKGVYSAGPTALRLSRLAALVKLGIIPASVVPHEVVHPPNYHEWDEFTPEEKEQSCRVMEAYAGMIETIDTNIGKVLGYLKETGEYDNTLIVFMSDNGGSRSGIATQTDE